MPATFLWFLFDWRGRIGRSPYRIAILTLTLTSAVLQIAPLRATALFAGMTTVQLIVSAALDAKRLHDIGQSAIWVAITGALGVGGVAAFAWSSPEAAALLTQALAGSLGPLAVHLPACIAAAGLAAAAALRSPFLWAVNSKPSGAVYDYNPRARASADPAPASTVSADEAIARALAEQKRRQRIAGPASAPRATAAPGVERKSFGRRVA